MANPISAGDTAWILTSTALVLLMTPGLAFFYGGMVRKKNILSTLNLSFIMMGVISVQWVLFGYSLAFGKNVAGLFGDLSYLGFSGVTGAAGPYSDKLPHLVFAAFQMMFAVITPALITGAFVERIRFKTFLVFMVLWATIVYDPLCHWVWGDGGWVGALGALDFAGGTVVHIAAGFSALAFALAMAGLMHKGLGFPMVYGTVFGILMVEGFIATTLDTAVRINRYLFEELWAIIFKNPPKFLKSYLFNSGLSVVLMLILGYTNAFTALWPIFGTANQLLAALTLITLVVWLAKLGKKYAFALMPALFMVVTTIFSLFYLLERYFKAHNYILLTTDVLMLALAVGIVIVAFQVRKHLVTKKS